MSGGIPTIGIGVPCLTCHYKYLSYCEHNDIVVFCLPPHTTHLLQPLEVGLYSHLQIHYQKAVVDHILTPTIGINHDYFVLFICRPKLWLINQKMLTRQLGKLGSVRSIHDQFFTNPKFPLLSVFRQIITSQQQSEYPLEQAAYTKCKLRSHTNYTHSFIQCVPECDGCKLILCFSHTAQYMSEQAHIANAQAAMVGEAVKSIQLMVKDTQQLGKGNLAGVIIGWEILPRTKE